MSLPIASAARIGTVDLVSFWDDDLDRPVEPVAPAPADGESPEDFERKAAAFEQVCKDYGEAAAAFHRRLKSARETQTWADVLKPDAAPVIFACKSPTLKQWEAFHELRPRLGSAYAIAKVLLRMTLVEIRGPKFDGFRPGAPVAHTLADDNDRPRRTALGMIGPEDLIEQIARRGDWSGELTMSVVEDIGTQILNHWMRAPVP